MMSARVKLMINYEKKKETTTQRLTIVYTFKIKKNELPSLFILPALLRNSGDSFHSRKEFTRLLYSYYGATIDVATSCIGTLGKLFVDITVPKKEYVGEDNFVDIVKLSKELVFADETRFMNEDLENFKSEYVKMIKNLEDNIGFISKYLALQQIDKNDVRNYPQYLSLKAFKKITIDDVIKVYRKLKTSHISYYFEGDKSKKYIKNEMNSLFSNSTRILKIKSRDYDNVKFTSKSVTKKNEMQSSVTLVYSFKKSAYEFGNIFNIILSKVLFKEIREKRGYCYFIDSVIDSSRNLIMVNALVNNEVVDDCIKAIDQVIGDLKISSNDINFAIKKFLNSLNILNDNYLNKVGFIESRVINGDETDIKLIAKKVEQAKVDDLMKIKDSVKLISTCAVIGGQ